MKKKYIVVLNLLVLTFLSACDQPGGNPDSVNAERFPGGNTTVSIKPFPSFMLPPKNIAVEKRPEFHAGKALARQPWIKAPTTTTARDGLGPIYNARTCLACHVKGGRGEVPRNNEEALFSAIVRISLPGINKISGVILEPVYGDQIQTQSVALSHQLRYQMNASESKEVQPEAYIHVEWGSKTYEYPDKQTIELQIPQLKFTNLSYGKFHSSALMELRNAPPILGVGLLELVEQRDIDELADPGDKNKDGISGRVNRVWDSRQKKTVAGRFGLKANKPNNLLLVTAAAFVNDIGITNPLFPNEICTAAQIKCSETPNGNDEEGVELPAHLLELTANFTRNLAVPARRNMNDPAVIKGRKLFYDVGCQLCHAPSFVTGASGKMPHLANQTIWPYSDMLIHDMGEELSSGRTDYDATGAEWRTPPLWGVGLSFEVNGNGNLLHDGRARNIEEAILWHGGEAERIKMSFVELSVEQRQWLISFVSSL